MPYDEWYDDATREAATARVLERRATKPGDRNVLTVVADEFGIPQQTLRAWVEEAAPEPAKPVRKPRPKFSQVVTTRIEPEPEPVTEPVVEPEPQPVVEPEPEAQPEPEPETKAAPPAPAAPPGSVSPSTSEIAALEAEVASLRAGNRVLTEAMRVLLEP